MKKALLVLVVFLTFIRFASAHPWAPPDLGYVAGSDSVYLVKVISSASGPDSVHPAKITLAVTEVLRGPLQSKFMLAAYEDYDFKKDTEWIIFHNPSGFKDCVGWAMEGDCEWLPIPVTRDGDKVTAKWVGPLDTVKEYLRQHPYKP
jgi:hypothetical protein